MTLVKFQPNHFKNLVDEFFNYPVPAKPANRPAVNVAQTENGYRLEVAAPGMSKEDFEVKIEKEWLTIAAKKEQAATEEGVNWTRREFSYGSFDRTFQLPETVDTENVKATYNNGVLNIELVKKPEHQPVVKTIAVA